MIPIIALTILVATVTAQEGQLTLEYASLVFRHGDRSPVGTYPNDPFRDQWPQGYGQLSYNGSRQHYQLGKLIRKRYTVEHSLVHPNYTRDQFYVRSTDYDRTLMSVLSQFSALFPPDDDKKLDDIDWQPIPVHTVPVEDDNLLRPHGMSCPRYDQLLDANAQTDYYKQVNKEHEELFRNIEEISGVDYTLDAKNIWRIADTVFVESQWGRNPGDWVNETVSNALRNLSNIDFYLMFSATNAVAKRRLTAGNLVGQIVDRMQNKIKNESTIIPGTQLVLYSAHDTTVGAFLSALEAFDNVQPPYAATVFVELYSDVKKNYFVQVLYLNKHTTEGFDLTNTSSLLIPKSVYNCSLLCPLDEFVKRTSVVVPADWEKECQVNSKGSSGNENHEAIVIGSIAGGIGAILVIMLLIVLITYISRSRRSYQNLKETQ